MTFTWEDLIARARVYIDDDHDETDGWIAPEKWLTIGNVEYAQLRRRWIRMGLIAPAPADATFTGYTTDVTGVLAIIGVAQDLGGGQVRLLQPAQSSYGRAPFWGTSQDTSRALYWSATGEADTLTVTLEPQDASGSYFVRYIATVAYATAVTDTIDLPYGADERLVLGMARRSKLKESGASRLLDGLIAESEAELNFAAFSRAMENSPRVRKVRRPARGFELDPARWRYA